MKRAFSRPAAVLLLAAMLLFPVGCRRGADVCDILSAALASQTEVPTGTVYSSRAEAGVHDALDSDLAAVLWGNGAPHPAYGLTNSAAIYLTVRELPFEMAVLECASTDSASDVALMCCERADLLSRTYGSGKAAFSVMIYGRYVVAVMCANNEAAQKAAADVIGKG